jgi:hypothetical protein
MIKYLIRKSDGNLHSLMRELLELGGWVMLAAMFLVGMGAI